MSSRILIFCFLGAAFGSLGLCFGDDPQTWFSFSIVMFLLSLVFSVFGEDRSPLVILVSLAYAALASWIFILQFNNV